MTNLWRYHKLVNDIEDYSLEIPTSSDMNTKFLLHLKAYEPHAKKTLKNQEAVLQVLLIHCAYVCSRATSAPALIITLNSSPQPKLSFPPTNNQLRTSSNSRTHATVHDGQIVTEPIQRKAPGNVGNTVLEARSEMLQT
ncbi:hypothetical protein Tco_0003152 [Tanacetum coccineum]